MHLTGETKTEAVRRALLERGQRLLCRQGSSPGERVRAFLERDVWPEVPTAERGRRLTRAAEDNILGYGDAGA